MCAEMTSSITELNSRVASQAAEIPAMYGHIDFSIVPERLATNPGDATALSPAQAALRPKLLANKDLVARIRAYTMIGDVPADAYAALMPDHGFRGLVTMLVQACERGLDAVEDAPKELVRFIESMETVPGWLDMKLIEQGARIDRNGYAHRAPFAIRGGFLATFMNKYAALPMALTGALSSETAARRVNETATFFTTSVMPGALDRHGAGFRAAAMVRLMHAMVRFNVLRRGDDWDFRTYGVPIPQVDQIPAGLISVFLLSQRVLRQGRTTFTPVERARVELARYRCFLLGLPEELLADTPQGIVDILLTRHATLRKGFDENCAALVKATMAAELTSGRSVPERVHAWLEGGFSKVFFVANFAGGDKAVAARMGVQVRRIDYAVAAAAALVIASKMLVYAVAARLPIVRDVADRSLVRKLGKQLAAYGHAEFTTDAQHYRPAHA
jgi:hypothetical protein